MPPRSSLEADEDSRRGLKSNSGPPSGPKRVALHGGGGEDHERKKGQEMGGWVSELGGASASMTDLN